MVSPHLFKKKYYCKIDGKNYGPMNFEELKNLAMNKQLKSSDKVSLTFPSKDWLEASSMPELYEIFKAQTDENDAFTFGGSTTTGATGFSQEVNIELLEKNLIKIVNLLIFVSVLVTLIGVLLVLMLDAYVKMSKSIEFEIQHINKKLPEPPKWETFESKKGNVNPD